MAIAQMMQFCIAALSVAKLPGNRYINGIVFGAGEVFSMVFSQALMNNMIDITAFYVCYSCCVLSYLMLIFFADSSAFVAYLANVLLITGVGGWFNTMLLILEMRVPSTNVGSVSALTRTIAVGSGVFAPTIANFEPTTRYICLTALATFALLMTFFLPPPGQNLCVAQKTGDASVVLLDKQSHAPTQAYGADSLFPMTNYALHQASF